MKFFKTPNVFKKLFSQLTWSISTKEQIIYLTFDDGPTPVVTPWLLELLNKYNAKATFFCIGEKITKYPHVYQQILNDKHCIGNHTFNHLNGWQTTTDHYINNLLKADEVILPKSKLFRPPYGKIKLHQAKVIKNKGFEIIMWDVLSYDFDQKLDHQKALNKIIKNTQTGSIIVFHDSQKAFENLQKLLPDYLAFFSQKGFCFKIIP